MGPEISCPGAKFWIDLGLNVILHLGVVEFPYEDKGGTTTGQVAHWLEDKYHIMEIFFETHQQFIADALNDALMGQIDNLLMGIPADPSVFASAEQAIQQRFTEFLTRQELDSLGIPGIPTEASGNTPGRVGGINHRFAHPYAKANPSRPSFIDTGLYQAAFKAWIEA
jgi:hypothetical protein